MIEERSFHLGDILTVVTSKLLSPEGMDGLYAFLNYMADDLVFTNQIPRVMDECRPHILQQYPQFEELDGSSINRETCKDWLNEQITKFGEYLTIKPLISGIHVYRDAAEEMEEQAPHAKVLSFDVGGLTKEKGEEDFDPRLN